MGTHRADEGNRLAHQHERDGGGAIVTFGNGARRHVEVFTGPQRPMADDIAAYCRGLGAGWEIRSISTPRTIYLDIIGRRTSTKTGATQVPENFVMTGSDRKLLAPHLLGQSDTAERRHRSDMRPS